MTIQNNIVKSETVLWGVLDGNEDWQEEILSTNPAKFEAIRVLAKRDGFGRFRISTIDLSSLPDFSKTINHKTT